MSVLDRISPPSLGSSLAASVPAATANTISSSLYQERAASLPPAVVPRNATSPQPTREHSPQTSLSSPETLSTVPSLLELPPPSTLPASSPLTATSGINQQLRSQIHLAEQTLDYVDDLTQTMQSAAATVATSSEPMAKHSQGHLSFQPADPCALINQRVHTISVALRSNTKQLKQFKQSNTEAIAHSSGAIAPPVSIEASPTSPPPCQAIPTSVPSLSYQASCIDTSLPQDVHMVGNAFDQGLTLDSHRPTMSDSGLILGASQPWANMSPNSSHFMGRASVPTMSTIPHQTGTHTDMLLRSNPNVGLPNMNVTSAAPGIVGPLAGPTDGSVWQPSLETTNLGTSSMASDLWKSASQPMLSDVPASAPSHPHVPGTGWNHAQLAPTVSPSMSYPPQLYATAVASSNDSTPSASNQSMGSNGLTLPHHPSSTVSLPALSTSKKASLKDGRKRSRALKASQPSQPFLDAHNASPGSDSDPAFPNDPSFVSTYGLSASDLSPTPLPSGLLNDEGLMTYIPASDKRYRNRKLLLDLRTHLYHYLGVREFRQLRELHPCGQWIERGVPVTSVSKTSVGPTMEKRKVFQLDFTTRNFYKANESLVEQLVAVGTKLVEKKHEAYGVVPGLLQRTHVEQVCKDLLDSARSGFRLARRMRGQQQQVASGKPTGGRRNRSSNKAVALYHT